MNSGLVAENAPSHQRSVSESVSLFVKEITVLDYAYLDPARGALGGSLDIDVEFIGGLDEEGVVFDFSHAKKAVKTVIDELCDHRLVCPSSSIVSNRDGLVELEFHYGEGFSLRYHCPEEAVCILNQSCVDIQGMMSYLEAEAMKVMPENVQKIVLHAREESLNGAPEYRYTHGLKQHYGNCQRLLHGHRNRIDVELEGERSLELEKRIAEEWNDIHLAFPENCPAQDLKMGVRQSHLKTVHVIYTSSQGKFEGWLPGESVYIMPYETTVENISRHLCEKVASSYQEEKEVKVWAYEGIRKGSLSSYPS
jgi:6-pyruvoyl-tetrahydropterin synthase